MDQQPLPRFLCHWENLESARWQEVSSDVKGCLSGRERKFLNGDLLLLLFITVFLTYRLDNTIYRWKGGQNSCGWSPFYWFSLTDNLFEAGGGIQLCFALSFHLSLFNEFPCVDIDKIGLTEIHCVPLCEKFGTFQTSDNG